MMLGCDQSHEENEVGKGIQSDWLESVLVWSGKVSLKKQPLSRNRRKQLCIYLGEDHSVHMEPRLWLNPWCGQSVSLGKGEGNKAEWAGPLHLLPSPGECWSNGSALRVLWLTVRLVPSFPGGRTWSEDVS